MGKQIVAIEMCTPIVTKSVAFRPGPTQLGAEAKPMLHENVAIQTRALAADGLRTVSKSAQQTG